MEFSIVANPIFIPAPFAINGIKNAIEKARQAGQDPQDATWLTGWEGVTFTPIELGGKPPKGQDFNGIFYALSDNAVHVQNGNRYKFSQDVIDNYGGYAKDAIVQSDDGSREFISLVDSNTVNPNNGLAGVWSIYAGSGSVPAATSTTAGVTRVINALNSTEIAAALSAAQGKVLKDTLDKFVANRSTNGSLTIPLGISGLSVIVKWGLITNLEINTTRVVTFGEAFPSACLNLQITPYSLEFSNIIENMIALWSTPTRTQFTVRNTWVGDAEGGYKAGNAYWFAIGY